jgi:hypothetical protein
MPTLVLRYQLDGCRNEGLEKIMADENIVTWNVTNWVTIVLMAAIGLGLLGLAQKYIASKKGV